MKLYKTTYIDDAAATTIAEWDKAAGDASKARTRLKKEGMREIETKDVDVPTDKAGLLKFLNGGS